MTPYQRYVAEEIAVDHADGLMTRREALRRLGLLGLTATAASALLAACSSSESSSNATTTSAAPSSAAPTSASAAPVPPVTNAPGMSGAVATQEITFGNLRGAFAPAANPKGAVLVVHENRGLTDHIRNVAGRFAGAGYSALAIDLLSEAGGTGSFKDPAEATAALTKISPDTNAANLKAGIGELERRVPGKKIGATGFCLGGGMTWLLLGSAEPRLAAAVPWYGPLGERTDFSGTKAAVLAIYAEKDARVNASRDAAVAALQKADLTHEVFTAPGADHAFFNDTGQRYNAQAAEAAWQRVTAWFGTHLG